MLPTTHNHKGVKMSKLIGLGSSVIDTANIEGIICRKRNSHDNKKYFSYELSEQNLLALGVQIRVTERTKKGRASKLSIDKMP